MSSAARQRALTFQVASLLLSYPEDLDPGQLDLVEQAVPGLPTTAREPLARALAHLRRTSTEELAKHYVSVFDQKRSCCLYLTYYPHGDTRRRGQALLRFQEIYRAAGMRPPERELPDHLAVVLEFAATVDAEAGEALLREHRPGLELLLRALQRVRTPYADVVAGVLAVLPPATREDLETAARVATEGPPQELVGLSPYAADPELAVMEVRR